ncbi:MAG TPA: tetrahydrofolate dehydrogenase/cyclohydrolase catalytic domain-containing protein, partial [Bacteroidales bacterium]|nr:tetrahydrofolate dehydrogenase/cyclohydrolase catalytic domain-containing protein [Bacteroidales bacterium]
MTLLDGKVISEAVKNEIKKEVASLIDAGKRAPHLVAVLVGSDPASQSYVASKDKACKSIGMTSSLYL